MSKITSMFSSINGMSADLIKAVAQVSTESNKKAAQEAGVDNAALASKFESFRPLGASKVDNSARPIERLYAGMKPVSTPVQERDSIAKRVAALQEQTHPTTDKEKKLAAMAHPKDKITHKDVMVGRGVIAKEEAEPAEKKGTNPFDWKNYKSQVKRKPGELTGHDSKKISTGTVYTKKAVDEENELDEDKAVDRETSDKAMASFVAKGGKVKQLTTQPPKKSSKTWITTSPFRMGRPSATTPQRMGEGVNIDQENTSVDEGSKDTPGQEHICAVHVKHAKLGEGRTLTSQHAEPAEDGSIAWYDVMFAEGISRVDTEELEILVSESHMNHKKKMK